MRLVIDGHRLTSDRTGVGRCLEGLLAGWAETGWPLDDRLLVLRYRGGRARVPDSPGLKTVVMGEGWPGLIWETFALGNLLGPGDLLFAPANVVPWNWRGPTVAVIYDTLLWSVPESFPWHVRLRFGWRYRLAARRASRVIVPSDATACEVSRVHRIPPDRIERLYPGPEPRFRPLPIDAPEVLAARDSTGVGDAPFFLFVGKRSRRRHVDAILNAFALHRVCFPANRLVFVGPNGGERAVGEGVIDAGHVNEDVLHGLYAAAVALLYPSDHEGFGLPVVEAQASGCPVVTLKQSALVESAGEAAWTLESAEAGSIAKALEALAGDPRLRSDLVERGLGNAQRFPLSAFVEGVRREIRRVAGVL